MTSALVKPKLSGRIFWLDQLHFFMPIRFVALANGIEKLYYFILVLMYENMKLKVIPAVNTSKI